MKVTFVQTSDPIFYLPLLEQTSKAVRCYCLKNGFSYESYIGIKRGVMPWNAAYNRIIILKELLDRQTEGWVFYLDADAYVHDMDFDLLSYLIDKDRYGAIFAGYINNVVYDINSGGFAINFSHPAGKGLVYDYYNLFRSISDEQFNSAAIWNSGEIGDDQHLLYTVLKRYFDTTKIHENFLFEHTNQSFVNNGPFICQQLRSLHHNFDERAASIGKNVLALLPQDKDVRQMGGPGIYMPSSHPRLISGTGRKESHGIVVNEPGTIFYGPYITLKPGEYIARIFGEVRTDTVTSILSDVSFDFGKQKIAEHQRQFQRNSQGLLVEYKFQIERPTQGVEVRAFLMHAGSVSIHALQILQENSLNC